MPRQLIITITGPDRIGFVESVTKLLLNHGVNVEKSRMVRLGGDFAMMMLVTVPNAELGGVIGTVMGLEAHGFQVFTRETATADGSNYAGWLPFRIQVSGADHEGIIHKITSYLAEQGVNIETLSTGADHAPMSGTPLFTMDALVLAPPKRSLAALRAELEGVGDRLNVDIEVSPFRG